MSSYDGKASLVFSSGDSFAECHLVATGSGDGWAGTLSDILFRTQMVPTPLNPTEHLRLEDVDDKPVVAITVGAQDGDTAQVSGEGDPFS
ncbi:MAG: hypothetical protein ABW279_08260 [Acidimicrobiales bacterium]